MRVFVDANIIISVLLKEYPLFPSTSRILSLADSKRFTLYTSPVCLAIAFYFLEKKNGAAEAKRKIAILASKILVAGVNSEEVAKAIANKSVHDFEDGLQYYAALKQKCKVIITEDADDFYYSEIPVLGAENFLEDYVFAQ